MVECAVNVSSAQFGAIIELQVLMLCSTIRSEIFSLLQSVVLSAQFLTALSICAELNQFACCIASGSA